MSKQSPYIPNSIRGKKSYSGAEIFGIVLLALVAVPALALLAFAISLALAGIGSLVMLATVNWGLVTLGTVLGFTVHGVGFWGAFNLCYISLLLAGIFGGVKASGKSG